MIELKEIIKFRLGIKEGSDMYNGFDMSKTHSQEEENIRITEHNKKILELFLDYLPNPPKLDCWKGSMFLENEDINFGGWCSADIIEWLIVNQDEDEEEIDDEVPSQVFRIITRTNRYEVLKRQKWNCNQCGCKLKYSKNNDWVGEVAHIDHIYPYSKRKDYPNGEENINELSNLQALCPSCNLKKGKKNVN